MTNHREVVIPSSKHEVMFQLSLHIGLGDSFDKTLAAIKRHVEHDHQLGDSGIIFQQEVTQHLAAAIRIPSKYTLDDALLPGTLGLAPLVYDKGLPPPSESE